MRSVARNPDAPSRIELLILSTLARLPMHGYELKLELQYKHVRWWAKCEHGHLYAALPRLLKRGFIAEVRGEGGDRGKKVFKVTPAGLARARAAALEFGQSDDTTYFDVDLFISSAFLLDSAQRAKVFWARRQALTRQLAEAQALRKSLAGKVPAAGLLIMDHRLAHLKSELAFTSRAMKTLLKAPARPFLGKERIRDFVARTGVRLEAPR